MVPLPAPPSSYTAAVERDLTGAGIAKSSARIYRIPLTTWGWMLAGEPAPTGPARLTPWAAVPGRPAAGDSTTGPAGSAGGGEAGAVRKPQGPSPSPKQ